MLKLINLSEDELERMKMIFQYQNPRSWQELAFLYQNRGTPLGNQCQDVGYLSESTLRLTWSYLVKHGERAEIYGYLNYLISRQAYFWEYANYWESIYHDYEFKMASSRKVPKCVRKALSRIIGENKNLRYYFSGNNYYAVKHPEYGFLVTTGGSVVLKNTNPVYMLLNVVSVNV